MNTERMTAEHARALLNKDTTNAIERVAKKGGTLSEKDRRQLRKIVKRAETGRRRPAEAKSLRTPTIDPKSFEGTFEQKRRRRKVYELRLRNYSIREMATEVRTDTKTIMRDLNAIDEALQQQINPANATSIINETLMDLEAARLMAMDGLKDAEGLEKNGLLNTVIKASEVKIALLQDAGTLPKAGRKLELSGPDGVPLPTPVIGGDAMTIRVVLESTNDKDAPAVEYQIIDVASEQRRLAS